MNALRQLPIKKVHPNPNQPRKTFDADALDQLAASLKAHGQLQPIAVRPNENGFEIIAGERRWRAAQLIGWSTIAALVKNGLSDRQAYEISLMENVIREDLNAIEEAQGYVYLREMGVDDDDISEHFGKPKNYLTWRVALLDLRDDIQHLVAHNQMTPYVGFLLAKLSHNGQGRALREMNAQPMTMQAIAAMANTIYTQENETAMFSDAETKVDGQAQKAGKVARDFLRLAGAAAAQLGDYDDRSIGQGLISEVGAEDKAREIIRALQRIIGIERRRRGSEIIRQEGLDTILEAEHNQDT